MGLITFDLDSTLADTRWRHGMIKPDGSTDWQEYALACAQDGLITPVASLWRALAPHHTLWVVSGRASAARALTVRWLMQQGLRPRGLTLMETRDQDRGHCEWKLETIRNLEAELGLEHVLHIDDFPPVGIACREVGIECLVVTPPQRIDTFDDHRAYV